MKTLTERCEIELQALALGECEFKIKKSWHYVKVDESFIFDWCINDYRIKKEPRVIWATFYGDGNNLGNVSMIKTCLEEGRGDPIKFIEVIE